MLLLLIWAGSGQALDSTTASQDAALGMSLLPVVTPIYLEKSNGILGLGQDAGWQLGGVNSQFDAKSDTSAFSMRGGLFFSRSLGARNLIDAAEPLPDNRFGQQAGSSDAGAALGLPTGLFFSGPGHKAVTDQITYQRMNYTGHGLSLSGSYGNVGQDFKGLDALVQQMQGSDADGAKLLGLGMAQTNFSANYTGVRNLTLSTNITNLVNEQRGHGEYGLTRSNQAYNLGYALGARQHFDYSHSTLTETWDAALAPKDGREVVTDAWKLTSGVARNSQLSFGQTRTGTQTGQTALNVNQQDIALVWNEWKALGLTGGYTTKTTEQTRETNRVMTLGVTTQLLPNVLVTGNLVRNITERPSAAAVHNDTFNVKVASQLLPTVQVNSLFQTVRAPDNSEVTTQDQQLAWAINPRWKMSSRLLTTAHSVNGTTERQETAVAGQVGNGNHAEGVNLFTRTDTLPNDVAQARREISYSRALGSGATPATLLLQTGQYTLDKPDAAADGALATLQVLNLRPTSRLSMNLGYYDGLTLGANYLTYRSWGQKPQGNLELWTPTDFVPYRELGGEATLALSGSTKLITKQLFGQRADTGATDITEYGLEQRFGTVALLGGRRTLTPAGTTGPVEESWWQVSVPTAKALPAWAAESVRKTVFTDSAAWGLAQPPAWVATPKAGLLAERRLELVNNVKTDAYTARYTTMLADNLFLQASFERNPRKADNAAVVDPTERRALHLGWQARPALLFYLRHVQENRLDAQPSLGDDALGVIGTLSDREKLHLQLDVLRRDTGTTRDHGIACMVGYERIVSAEDSLSLKYRIIPREFATPETRIYLEAGYQRAF